MDKKPTAGVLRKEEQADFDWIRERFGAPPRLRPMSGDRCCLNH